MRFPAYATPWSALPDASSRKPTPHCRPRIATPLNAISCRKWEIWLYSVCADWCYYPAFGTPWFSRQRQHLYRRSACFYWRTEIIVLFLLMSKHLQILQAMYLLNLLRELNRSQISLVGETKDYFAILSTVFFKLTSASVFCGSIRNASLKSELAFS